jgi:hypothetical protein
MAIASFVPPIFRAPFSNLAQCDSAGISYRLPHSSPYTAGIGIA